MSAKVDIPPHKIIKAYKQALKGAKGSKFASQTQVQYIDGWFVVSGVNGKVVRYRRKQIVFNTEALIEQPFDKDAYEWAVAERLVVHQVMQGDLPVVDFARRAQRQKAVMSGTSTSAIISSETRDLQTVIPLGFQASFLFFVKVLAVALVVIGVISVSAILQKNTSLPLVASSALVPSPQSSVSVITQVVTSPVEGKPKKDLNPENEVVVTTPPQSESIGAFSELERLLTIKKSHATRGSIELTEKLTGFTVSNKVLTVGLSVVAITPDGSATTRVSYTIPTPQIDFGAARTEPTELGTFKLIFQTSNFSNAIKTSVSVTGTGSYQANSSVEPDVTFENQFGFSFVDKEELERAKELFAKTFASAQKASLTSESEYNIPSRVANSRDENDNYRSVLGNVQIGIALYDKLTHAPFGFVVDVDWGYVWVATQYSSGGSALRLYARKYERSHITQNYVTK